MTAAREWRGTKHSYSKHQFTMAAAAAVPGWLDPSPLETETHLKRFIFRQHMHDLPLPVQSQGSMAWLLGNTTGENIAPQLLPGHQLAPDRPQQEAANIPFKEETQCARARSGRVRSRVGRLRGACGCCPGH